jgi:glucose/arabinose dehydrogenase
MRLKISKRTLIIAALSIIVLNVAATGWWIFMTRRINSSPSATVDPQATPENTPPATSVLTRLDIPWELVFLPDGSMLFTERPGTVKMVDIKNGPSAVAVFTVPDVAAEGEGGLLGMALHTDFARNGLIYFYHTYSTNSTSSGLANRVVRYLFQNGRFSQPVVVFDGIRGESIHDGGRIKFGPDGCLYITCGDSSESNRAQDLNSPNGKIHQIRADGSIPADNPFPGSSVYSYGHRNPEGLAWDDKGQLWETEHGSIAHDEVNLIQPGKNYGWPVITGNQTRTGMESPIIQSGQDTWAPSGLAVFDGKLYFAGLRGQRLYEVTITGDTPSLKRYYNGSFGRLRDVVVGPDGLFYVLTNNRDGRGYPTGEDDQIIRINPSKLAQALSARHYYPVLNW